MLTITKLIILNLLLMTSKCSNSDTSYESIIWSAKQLDKIEMHQPEILGKPEVIEDIFGVSVYFNGKNDGLIFPVNPLAGWEQFTVEVLFKPDSDGLPEQRFLHFQDVDAHRGLIETRVTPAGNWSLDTFLYNNEKKNGLTLLDREIQHPCDYWYWVALVYDGTTMSHYVNGEKELEGEIEFGPMKSGKISIGVRLNQVHWFKGAINEIRFHSKALNKGELQTF